LPDLGGDDLDEIQAGLQRLAAEHGRLQELLNAVLAISGHLELEEVLHTIVEAARELVRAQYAAVGVLDDQGQFTELITSGFGVDQFAERVGELPHGTGLLGDLVRDPRPLRVEDLPSHPRAAGFPAGHPVMTTLLGVPIRVRDTVYGNLYLADKADGPFTDRDEEVVSALASAAGVSIENARLYARLRAATEDFQRRLLPQMPQLHEWELQARYQPSSQAPSVGGDWYDVIHLPDRVPCVMVGDVMGHDLRAATVMSQISNMLRVIAFDQREPPSRILQRLDRALHELHGGPMATVIVVRLEGDGAGRQLRWASAGHLPPLLAVPGEPARYLEADVGPPLGVDPDVVRPDHEHRLPVGATVLLHTDGLIEDRAHTLDEGMRGAARIATGHADRPLPQLCDALLARCRQGGEHDLFEDDVALLAARLKP
jgi:serine phosphatase RsbU (regulator of sigma subunit)